MAVWLTIGAGPEEGTAIELGEEIVIGRDPDADLTLDDPGVSRRHVSVRREGETAIVTDLDSSNGTFVNGERIETPRRLLSGDLLQIGASTLTVDAGTTETERIDSPTPTDVSPASAQPPRADPEPRPEPPPPRREPIPYPDERRPQQRPAGPDPHAHPAAAQQGPNWQAIAAAVLGPLSILLLVAGSGAAFYAALPCGVLAIALASVGKRQTHSGASMRGVAVFGQVTGVVGTILATLVVLVLVAVSAATDIAADNLPDLIDEVEAEIRGQVESNLPE